MGLVPENWSQTTIHCSRLTNDLRAGNLNAWRLLEERYGPLVWAFARHRGLPPELADDAKQDTMLAFLAALRNGKYERSTGTPRAYLFGIARNIVSDLLTSQQKQPVQVPGTAGQTTFFRSVADDKSQADEWRRLEQAAIAAQCLREARDHFSSDTFLMFYRRVIDGLSAAETSRETGTTAGAVNMAVHHVRTFLRQIEPLVAEAF